MLEHRYGFDESGMHEERMDSGNMIIHGDNLVALKSLLLQYEGKVDCIYIDPPYNTGNEGWVYNDRVSDPKIVKWLGQVVGREGEDLSRHDKWLCMMYPRLRLLHKLLKEDGVIFISIDDIEYANLKLICDEIFGSRCFVTNISWQRTYSTRNDSKGIVNEVEHILVYSKQPEWSPNKLPRTAEMDAKYKNPDHDVAPWRSDNPFAPGAATHQGMVYAIQHPFTGEMVYPSSGRCWPFMQDTMHKIMRGWANYELKELDDASIRAQVCGVSVELVRTGVMGIVLADSLDIAREQASQVLKQGPWPRFYFTKNGKGGIARKTYLNNVEGRLPTNLWEYQEVGHTDEAKKELLSLFDGQALFDTPKPTRLIEHVLKVATSKDSIVLDSFAGSGTTAHAVLRANQADGGNRKFILVEMGDYAETVTAERVKRVIRGYGEGKKAVDGTGGGFDYYEMMEEPFFYDGENINSKVPVDEVRKYIYFTETRKTIIGDERTNDAAYLGLDNGTAYYLFYSADSASCLNHALLAKIKDKAEQYVIYADTCQLSPQELDKYNIIFKKIPRDITKL